MGMQVTHATFLWIASFALGVGHAIDIKNTLALSSGNTDFAFNLYRDVASKAKGGNVFLSPISISTAMAMTYAGTKGQTKLQMANVLRFTGAALQNDDILHNSFKDVLDILNDPTNNYTLQLANRLFAAQNLTLQSTFLQKTKKCYYAEAQAMDFSGKPEASRLYINSWVANQTNQKIKDLIKKYMINSATMLVLVNCIYFKGLWKVPFDESATKKDKFYLSSGSLVDIDMMNIKQYFKYQAVDSLNSRIVEIPYSGDEISMLILLPNDKKGLPAVESKVTHSSLNRILRDMKSIEIQLTIPKFTLTQEISLDGILSEMGMKDLFTPGLADLSGMFSWKGPYVSAAIHKAFVQVDEKGTEAAAATAVLVVESAPVRDPVIFKVDRPFLFFIREKATGSILFIGRITKPVGAEEEPPITSDTGHNNASLCTLQQFIYIMPSALFISGIILMRL